MQLRHVLLISTALTTGLMLAGTSAAVAADPFDWNGFYASVGITSLSGAHSGTLDVTYNNPPSVYPVDINTSLINFPTTFSTVGVGVDVGFNVQMDSFLLGLEAGVMKGVASSGSTWSTSTLVTFSTSTITTGSVSTSETTFYNSTTLYQSFTHTIFGGITDGTTISTVGVDTTSYQSTSFTGTDSSVTHTVTGTSVATTTVTNSASDTTYYSTTYQTFPTSTSDYATASIYGRASIDWLATIKGRAGFVADRTLFFATAGLAVGQVTQQVGMSSYNPTPPTSTDVVSFSPQTTMRVGYVIGAGIEHALTDNITIKGEADYFNLGTATYTVPVSGGTGFSATQIIDGYALKGAISFKF